LYCSESSNEGKFDSPFTLVGCSFSLAKNQFTDNIAFKKGGAIYYNSKRPIEVEPSTFDNNLAPYGSNYGSFPFMLKVINEDISWLQYQGSG
jgi:hypothetical protein